VVESWGGGCTDGGFLKILVESCWLMYAISIALCFVWW